MKPTSDIQSYAAGIVTASLKQLRNRCGVDLSCPYWITCYLFIMYGPPPTPLKTMQKMTLNWCEFVGDDSNT